MRLGRSKLGNRDCTKGNGIDLHLEKLVVILEK